MRLAYRPQGRLWICMLVCALLAGVAPARADDAATLRARYAALQAQLANNPFQRPIHVESSESAGTLKGDIFAVVAQPYATVGPALQGTSHWCEMLILHLNVKGCRPTGTAAAPGLLVHLGRKFDQPIDDSYPVQFSYRVAAARPDYLRIVLSADKGPLYTRDYRIVLEAVALEGERSFLHLSYSYGYGRAARMAMLGYLGTLARDKVGFSVVDPRAQGRERYIGGMRGVVERNTMRYYLAVEAYLGALSAPPEQRLEKRLNDWHSAVERYPLQLQELTREEYLAMKRREIQRQEK